MGGRTAPTQRKTLNRATDMKMPVGSAIKPLSVYAPPSSWAHRPPVSLQYPRAHQRVEEQRRQGFVAQELRRRRLQRPVTLREAIKRSQNVSAAQVLLNMVGVDRSVDFLLKLGVDKDHIDATPFGLALRPVVSRPCRWPSALACPAAAAFTKSRSPF